MTDKMFEVEIYYQLTVHVACTNPTWGEVVTEQFESFEEFDVVYDAESDCWEIYDGDHTEGADCIMLIPKDRLLYIKSQQILDIPSQ